MTTHTSPPVPPAASPANVVALDVDPARDPIESSLTSNVVPLFASAEMAEAARRLGNDPLDELKRLSVAISESLPERFRVDTSNVTPIASTDPLAVIRLHIAERAARRKAHAENEASA